jgi:hypothetical protein
MLLPSMVIAALEEDAVLISLEAEAEVGGIRLRDLNCGRDVGAECQGGFALPVSW